MFQFTSDGKRDQTAIASSLTRRLKNKKYQEMVAGYYRMISGVDLVVGRIRDALRKHGLADNTVIVFTADNGYFLGERGFADKWYIYEHSIRVPLIVFNPLAAKNRRGQVNDRMG